MKTWQLVVGGVVMTLVLVLTCINLVQLRRVRNHLNEGSKA